MTRRKAEKLPLPQTAEEAIRLIAAYAAADAAVEQVRAEADARIAAIRAEADIDTARFHVEIKGLIARLQPWWDIAAPALTGGTRKSVELAGCVIGHRLTPPKVVLVDRDPDEMVAELIAGGFDALVRIKRELNKPAILTVLVTEDAATDWMKPILTELGLRAVQKEEFFIDRVQAKAPAVEVVAAPTEQVPA